MSFRITGLPAESFSHLFGLPDQDLAGELGRRLIARGGEPCRISLTDAAPGEELLLVNYEHLPVESPYRMRYAIYIRNGETRFDEVGAIPEQLRRRMLALRAFDSDGMIVAHRLVDGRELEPAIDSLLGDPKAAYLHAHFASAGCYAARIDRA